MDLTAAAKLSALCSRRAPLASQKDTGSHICHILTSVQKSVVSSTVKAYVKYLGEDLDLIKVSDQGKANGGRCSPAPSPKNGLDLEWKRTSEWFKMNSTTAGCICTSMKAALLLMQADSLCCDLKKKQMK